MERSNAAGAAMPFRHFSTVVIVTCLGVAPAVAGQDAHSTVRLIAGERIGDQHRAGVEISLDKGWKTYWRMPGESGVPPEFDWSKSANVASAEVRYPVPHRFTDAGGEAIGYKSRVVFPVAVRPKDRTQPVELRLTLHYAVCMDICIPAKAEIERRLDGTAGSLEDIALVRQAEALVPSRDNQQLDLVSARIEATDGQSMLVVELAGEASAEPVDLFVEGFDDAYFRAPERRADGLLALRIDGLTDRSALSGRTLTLTVVAGDARLVRDIRVK